ncbi:cytochrome P450 CYP749A22-like [Momordica charantia]|uniref:Cytochrome P450 CYP749A22-like n=1 Tax=Momordica charantia TaxID=3673 RepID=A0A6J1D6R8_MOMCH|nr:cytochrome P450 CYP749A22-like [Momordica charantia]XP_022149053.1 cytochrome P450 CYP749A22-like [Momordica charantia]
MKMNINIYVSTFVFGCLLFGTIKLFIKLWWTPIRIQRFMRSQGIQGPSYNFIQGNAREMHTRRTHAIATPIDLSHRILPRVLPHTHSWLHRYGRNFIQWFGVEAQLIITDPEMIREVLHDRQKKFPKAKLHGFLNKIFGNGLVTAEGETWAKSRKIANFAFHGDTLKNMIPAMIGCAETMMEEWKHYEGKELDVFQHLKVYTSDVISHTAFGSSYEQGKNIFQMLQNLCELIIRNGFKIRLPGIRKIFKSKDDVEGERLEKRMKDCFMEVIKSREEKFINGEADGYGNDFLGLLVKAKNDPEESQRISVDDIVDECKTFYFAGHETTSVLLAWTMFLLALHKQWQDQARDEVFKVFGDKNPTSEGLPKLKTMTMILYECLRLYPPAMTVGRQVMEKEVRLGSLVLPATIRVTIPTAAVHHDTAYWGEDASEFKPERFAEGVAKAIERNSAAYLPFGLGGRSCVGMNFAMKEAKIGMSMILQRYSFTLSPAYAHSPVQFLTICPQHGLQLILHSISDHTA